MAPTIIPAIFLAKDRMTSKIEQMQSKISRFASTTAEKFDKAGKTAFKVGRQAAMVGVMIAAPLVLAAKTAVDFEQQMGNVSTLIDTNTESIQKMGDSVLAMAGKLPVPIEELTASLYDIRSAGIDASKQFETLESAAMLSVAGLSTVAEATNISTSALNAFRTESLSAAKTNDILFKTVKYGKTTVAQLSVGFGATAGTIQSAGVTLADFSAATAALTTVGTPATQAQTQLRAAIVALQKPTKEMDKIFAKLGVTSEKELIKREGGMVGAFTAINKAGTDMGLNLSKAWSSTEAVAAVNSVTGATKDTYLKAFEDMVNGPEALGEAFDKQGGTAKAQMQLLKNNAQSLAITVGQALLPVINDLVTALLPYIKSAGQWIKNNKPLVTTIVKVAAVVAGLAFAVSAASFAIGIYQKAAVLAKAAQLLWNAAMMANPIVAMVVGLSALAIGIYAVAKAFDTSTTAERVNAEIKQRALDKTIDQRVEIIQLFAALKSAKVGTEAYTTALSKIDAMQPGITKKYMDQNGVIRDQIGLQKELTTNIMKRAEAEVRAEMLKESIKKELQLRGGEESTMQSILRWTGGENAANMIQAGNIAKEQNTQRELSSQIASADPQNTDKADGVKEVRLVVNGNEVGTLGGLQGKETNVSMFSRLMPQIPQTR